MQICYLSTKSQKFSSTTPRNSFPGFKPFEYIVNKCDRGLRQENIRTYNSSGSHHLISTHRWADTEASQVRR